jgi:hypothetical protein
VQNTPAFPEGKNLDRLTKMIKSLRGQIRKRSDGWDKIGAIPIAFE